MPFFEVEFEVYCATCGNGLCNQSNGSNSRRMSRVDVEVCQNCIDKAKEEASEKAYQDGYTDALNEINNK